MRPVAEQRRQRIRRNCVSARHRSSQHIHLAKTSTFRAYQMAIKRCAPYGAIQFITVSFISVNLNTSVAESIKRCLCAPRAKRANVLRGQSNNAGVVDVQVRREGHAEAGRPAGMKSSSGKAPESQRIARPTSSVMSTE